MGATTKKLIDYLKKNEGKPLDRPTIARDVFGYTYYGETQRTVDMHISKARRHIDGIKTLWGRGYIYNS